jgi:hypothetical protein
MIDSELFSFAFKGDSDASLCILMYRAAILLMTNLFRYPEVRLYDFYRLGYRALQLLADPRARLKVLQVRYQPEVNVEPGIQVYIHLLPFQGTRYCAKDVSLIDPDEIKAAKGELDVPNHH